MSDQIIIRDLEIYSNHGVYKEEKILGQKFLVSAVLDTDTRRAGVSDKIEFSVNYGKVCAKIAEIMDHHTFDLIERVAEVIAGQLLQEFPMIQKVCLEVKKPWAPIGMPLESVSVKITRGWHRAYISMGSNMGDRMELINGAVEQMEKQDEIRVIAVSGLTETKPWGEEDQPDFINGCLAVDTLKKPGELLDYLKDLEDQAGRIRTRHWGPRTLDLDILLYDDLVLDQEELVIPHKWMHRRSFVLEPLCEIAPYVRHPLFHQTARQLLEALERESDT